MLWARTAGFWHSIASTTAARIGSHGITDGATRTQGTDTTPTGTYTITEGFGVGANPGTNMPYHQVTTHDWWVQDPTSAYYNQMRTDTQGGFHLTEAGDDGSEHLINYPVQYHNALVINFNMNPVVKGRGAGIFLHDLGPKAGPTSGCVAVPVEFMTRIMRWIDPADHPVIAIG
jgi:L,D-peptidoglycan transpeptidase YkuD (ErfK/YbiS/YcfS/YnhG family)